MVIAKMFNRLTRSCRTGAQSRLTPAAILLLASLLVATASPVAAQDGQAKWWSGNELRLNLVNSIYWVEAIHANGGWQITVNMQAKDRKLLGIGMPSSPPLFPATDQTGFLVFDDPDSCPSFLALGWQVGAYESMYCFDTPTETYPGCTPPDWSEDPNWPTVPGFPDCPPDGIDERNAWIAALETAGFGWPKDETWSEFTPGLSIPDEIPPLSAAGFEEDRPEVWVWGSDCDVLNPSDCTDPGWVLRPYGPELGSTFDDITYGHMRRVPGLVVVADHGPGVRFKPPQGNSPAGDFFDAIEPREAWNLAGFFNSAAYSLKGGTGETSLMAHLNVPKDLFKPVVLADNNITNHVGSCAEGTTGVYRMDGGPLVCVEGFFGSLDSLLYETTVTVRVFMVDGVAPDYLIDEDGDGDVDIHDAELMGLHPISRQETMRFRQWFEDECDFRFDFDNNGDPGYCVAPANPGGLTRPPR